MRWLNKLMAPLSSLTDAQAMWRVQKNDDPEAFAELVRRWERPIRDLCIRMTGDQQAGEDIAQETFVRLFASRERFEQGRKFSTWLWRIALNLCHDERRRVSRRGEFPLEEEALEENGLLQVLGPGPDQQILKKERAELVQEAVACLPETHRVVVVLREYEGLKMREIAEILKIPEGTVKSRMADALSYLERRLKKILSEENSQPVKTGNIEKATV